MLVLMLSWEYPPHVVGGMGRHVAELVPALAQGVAVQVVTPVATAEESSVAVEDGLIIHRVFAPAIAAQTDIYSRAIEVNKVLEAYVHQTGEKYGPYDLIHTHDWLTSFAGIALQKSRDCPLVATIHATERGRSRKHLSNNLQWAIDNAEHDLATQARRVIVCSHHMANEIQYFFQVNGTKTNIIPNGVNAADLRNGHNPDELAVFRTKYAAPNEQIVFTVARLVYEKGIHLLIQATPRILEECPRTQIIIAGKGPEAEILKQQAQNLGVADRVNFIGFISNTERNRLFKVADCSVFPSLYEPFGIVALEAMVLGSPLVVSDTGGFSEVVKHAETGIKIYPDNVDSTAWGITNALTNPHWAKKHAAKAYHTVEQLFNWPHIASLTEAVYRHALDEHTAP